MNLQQSVSKVTTDALDAFDEEMKESNLLALTVEHKRIIAAKLIHIILTTMDWSAKEFIRGCNPQELVVEIERLTGQVKRPRKHRKTKKKP